jgi:hypothetical protein
MLKELSREYLNYGVPTCDVYFLNTSLITMCVLVIFYFVTRIYMCFHFGRIKLRIRDVAFLMLFAGLGSWTLVSERGLETGRQPSADKPMAYNVFVLDMMLGASGLAATEVLCALLFFWKSVPRIPLNVRD